MLRVEVYIKPKKTVADPQGVTIRHALGELGYSDVRDVRAGKLITMELDTDDRKKAERQAEEMCKRLLANPIIEDYTLRIS